ncbi:MAG TPA: FAD:protein FMN transferase [Aeromicrobium sp.]|nr:FAD:protein FMN transferase [Aeromicrobium sp.]
MSQAWAFDAIGTAWQIDTPNPLPPDVRDRISARIEQFDRTWSRFRADSAVMRLAEQSGEHVLDGADVLLAFYDDLVDVTAGAVNPLVGRALSDLGYDATYSLTPTGRVAHVPDWNVLDRRGDVVMVGEPVLVDVGAAGKGRLVDLVAAILRDSGVHEATIDAGGDLYHCGPAPLRVALEHPADASRAIGVVTLPPQHALCGSAVNRRAWGDGLHHVVDGRTGRPTREVVATWALVPHSCMQADGLATAHFFADPDVLTARFDHEFVRVHADGSIIWSTGLPGEVFT